jgi:hypothetical protein
VVSSSKYFSCAEKAVDQSLISLLTPELVRQGIERKLGLDEGSLFEHEAFFKQVTQNTMVCILGSRIPEHGIFTDYQQKNTPSDFEAGKEEGSKVDVLDEPEHKLEEVDGNEQPSYGLILSSKRKRAESSSKPDHPLHKKPAGATPKTILVSNEDELSDFICEDDKEDSYGEESEAEAQKLGKTRPPNSSKVKTASASCIRSKSPAAREVEDSDGAQGLVPLKAPSRKSKSPREGSRSKGLVVIEAL